MHGSCRYPICPTFTYRVTFVYIRLVVDSVAFWGYVRWVFVLRSATVVVVFRCRSFPFTLPRTTTGSIYVTITRLLGCDYRYLPLRVERSRLPPTHAHTRYTCGRYLHTALPLPFTTISHASAATTAATTYTTVIRYTYVQRSPTLHVVRYTLRLRVYIYTVTVRWGYTIYVSVWSDLFTFTIYLVGFHLLLLCHDSLRSDCGVVDHCCSVILLCIWLISRC